MTSTPSSTPPDHAVVDVLPEARRDILWKQYANHVDLYKFYLDLTLKAVAFYYGITGGILSYYFSHEQDRRMKFSLALPILMSFAIAAVLGYGARLMKVVRDEIFNIVAVLGLETGVEVQVLVVTLWTFAVVLALTGCGLGLLLWAQF